MLTLEFTRQIDGSTFLTYDAALNKPKKAFKGGLSLLSL